MIDVEPLENGDFLIDGTGGDRAAPADGLMIHGYGGNKSEVLGLTLNLAFTLRVRMLVFDLPGHGEASTELFTLNTARAAVEDRLLSLSNPSFVVGHSLGARLALMTEVKRAIIISMPGPALFEGRRRDLLDTLRARRVHEDAPFSGLQEILAADVTPAEATLLLRAKNDIRSCLDLEGHWEDKVDMIKSIPDSNHLDIVSHPETGVTIARWLNERLS